MSRHCYRTLVRALTAALWFLSAPVLPAQTSPATLPDLKLSTKSSYMAAIAIQPDGKVIIGGSFQAVNNVPRRNIARLNSNGSVDLTGDARISSASVSAILASGTNIYVGGFVGAGSSRGVVRVSALDGSPDMNWGPGTFGSSPRVYAIAVNGDDLYIGGSFTITTPGGLVVSNIAKL